MRTERQNRYFKEQVLMREDMKIIAKTHKGESILNVENYISRGEDNENENTNKFSKLFSLIDYIYIFNNCNLILLFRRY